MTRTEAIVIINNEKDCVQNRDCDRACGFCTLAKEEAEIVEAFDLAIKALKNGDIINESSTNVQI